MGIVRATDFHALRVLARSAILPPPLRLFSAVNYGHSAEKKAVDPSPSGSRDGLWINARIHISPRITHLISARGKILEVV